MKRPHPHSYWVEPGRLLAGEHPAAEGGAALPKRLRRLLDAGIDCFIDLTQPGECAEYQSLLPASVICARLPLIDHAVPSDPVALRQVLAALDEALGQGRRVHVHCRAGIGRTGLVIGCHLIESGERPESALETLNTLWQQDARAPRWPRVPETAEQERYLLHWRARGAAAATFSDRATGAVYGLALGDAQAAAASGSSSWTDDTAMTLCVADSLAACRGVDARDQLERYRRWMQGGDYSATGEAVGLRPIVRRAIAMAGWRRGFVMGAQDPTLLDPVPLVRCIAPALFFHRDRAAAVLAGAETARVTHQAPLVVDACRLFTGLLQRVLAGEGKRVAIAAANQVPGLPLKQELQSLAADWAAGAPRRDLQPDTILAVLDDVVRAFAAQDDFTAGLQPLLARRTDADVACAAYGQLAGALCGWEGLPAHGRATLVAQDKLARAVAQLTGTTQP